MSYQIKQVRHLDIVGQRSKEYIKDKAAFQLQVAISKTMDKEGERLAQSKSIVFRKNQEDGKLHCFMLRGDCKDDLTDAEVQVFLDANYDSFDAYVDNWTRIYKLTFDADPKQWKNSHCTCPAFAQSFMCRHIVCVAYKLKILKRPKNDLLAPNSKRGRPKNATKGLSKD